MTHPLPTRPRRARLPRGSDATSTKDRLLDAAEFLFAEQGIQATSLREITARAGANLAAVNYHFTSKQSLVESVFVRRLAPLNATRLTALDRAESRSKGKPPRVEAILHALLDPTVKLWYDHPHFIRLLGRFQFEPGEALHRFFLEQFAEIIPRFKSAITRALPKSPLRELFWRMHFIFAAMEGTWIIGDDLKAVSDGLCRLEPYEHVVDRLVAFGAAGLRATHRIEEDKP